MQTFIITACATALLWFTGCAGPPPAKPLSSEERIQQDNGLGLRLAQDFEPSLNFKNDIEVQVYLRRVAKKMTDATPELKNTPVGVFLIKSRNRWHNYALPGNRIYLSTGLLKQLDYENEIAAVMAFELAHILNRTPLKRYQEMTNPGASHSSATTVPMTTVPEGGTIHFQGPGGLFAYSEEDELQAAEVAVGVLYRAGFDSRGLVSLWMKYQNNPGGAPFELSMLTKLLDRTRQVIANYTPLRNPVVRSKAFLAIQQRIKKL